MLYHEKLVSATLKFEVSFQSLYDEDKLQVY
jgi:hypothetical protein